MGVLTLKGPLNCEDLRHETLLPNRPQDKGSPSECEPSKRNRAGTGSPTTPIVRRKTPPFRGMLGFRERTLKIYFSVFFW